MDPIMIDEINEHTTNAVAGIDLSPLQTAIANVKASADAAITAANNAKAATDAAKSVAQTAVNNTNDISKITGQVKSAARTISGEFENTSTEKIIFSATNIILNPSLKNSASYGYAYINISGKYDNIGITARIIVDNKEIYNSYSTNHNIMLPCHIKYKSLIIYAKGNSGTATLGTNGASYSEYY